MGDVKVLVTGGNRYIGLELVRRLAREGHDVTVVNSHEVELPAGVHRLHADRRVPGEFLAVLAPHRDSFDAVYDNTAFTLDDLDPTLGLFSGRVQHYVFTSSTAVYRRSFVQPVRETFRTHAATDDDPRKAYGVNKVRCEQRLVAEHQQHGLATTCLRVSHTLGPRSPLVTRDPIFFARLEQGRPIFLPADGFAFVSLVHIADVASLMVSILGNDRAAGQIYNVTGTEVVSIAGAVHLMARAVGVDPNIVPVPLEVARHERPPLVHWGEAVMGGGIYSVDKALAELDWQPSFGIESGYRDSYEWFRSEGRDLYQYDFSRDEELLAALGSGRPAPTP
jgi:nucleoside-diphosphate-sugar epimerase